MRVLIFLFAVMLLFTACKELGDTIYEPPVIESLVLSPVGPVLPGDTVTAVVTAKNPEKGTLSYGWEVSPDKGNFLPPKDINVVKWIAPPEGDEYSIKAIVRNEKKQTVTKNITVLSLEKPYVKITSPSNNENFLIGNMINVEATAYHGNDLSKVWLLADNVYVDSSSWNSSNNYILHFTPDSTLVGPLQLKVLAEALNLPGNINSDYVNVNIQGIIMKSGDKN